MWDTLHRPLKFSDVLGQPGTVQLLKARLAKGTALDANYIFAGGFGCGKTTLARILARALLCQNLDKSDPEPCNECENCLDVLQERPGAYVEFDAASGGTIENVRGIIDDLGFAVFNAPKRVYTLDEAHRLSVGAQDALLKPLEEKKMVAIFCTTEPEKIRGPIRSRCEEYSIRKITREDILGRMKVIMDHHGVPHEDDAILAVIDYSNGHVRDVVNRLEMISQTGEVTLAGVREYLNLSVVSSYYEALLGLSDPKRTFKIVEDLCDRLGPEEVVSGLAEAAMNSYRLHHGMFADFAWADRQLGEQLYSRYQDGLLRLAEFFLRQRYVSKTGLLCDLLSLTKSVPTQMVQTVPVVVSPLPVSTSTVPRVEPKVPVPAPKVEEKTTRPPLDSFAKPKGMVRSDGIGNVGVDPYAQTSVDIHGVPRNQPRKRNQTAQTLRVGHDTSDLNKPLTPDEWRRQFESTWRELLNV